MRTRNSAVRRRSFVHMHENKSDGDPRVQDKLSVYSARFSPLVFERQPRNSGSLLNHKSRRKICIKCGKSGPKNARIRLMSDKLHSDFCRKPIGSLHVRSLAIPLTLVPKTFTTIESTNNQSQLQPRRKMGVYQNNRLYLLESSVKIKPNPFVTFAFLSLSHPMQSAHKLMTDQSQPFFSGLLMISSTSLITITPLMTWKPKKKWR